MRSSRCRSAILAVPTMLLVLSLAGTAVAARLELAGIISAGYRHSFQNTSLTPGGSFSDGNGVDVQAGFQAGQYLAFLVGWHWQSESDFDTHFIPLSIRGYSPPLLEDRIRLFGQFDLGLLYTRLHNEFGGDNERASALRTGLGVEVEITEDISGIVYGSYLWGLGSAEDYEWGSIGLGLEYRWGL